MEGIGAKLRAIRQKWGLSLREVEERSIRLAQEWGNPSYGISASWLDRIEREDRGLSAAKLIVLAVILSIPLDQLLALCPPGNGGTPQYDQLSSPNTTLLLTKGPLEEQVKSWLPDRIISEPIPDKTTLLPFENYLPNHYRRGIIGQQDNALAPMVRAGSFLFINTQRRSIAHRREWTHEFDRPIYFLLTHAGYTCGWCDLDKNTEWLTLVPHSMSYATGQRWKYRKDVEVVGRVAAILQRLEEPQPRT